MQHFALVNGVVTRLGPQLQISPTRTGGTGNPFYDQYLNDVVALPNGLYQVIYTGSDVSTDWTVYSQTFDAQGQNVGGEDDYQYRGEYRPGRSLQCQDPGLSTAAAG